MSEIAGLFLSWARPKPTTPSHTPRTCWSAFPTAFPVNSLSLLGFRNQGSFNEVVMNRLAADLFTLLQPHWLEVRGDLLPRGGIALEPSMRLTGEPVAPAPVAPD